MLPVTDYSALQQESALSQPAQAAESQQAVESAQQAVESAQHFVLSHFVHSVDSAESHFLQLLQHEHEAKANIAQTIAKDITTFFMVSNI